MRISKFKLINHLIVHKLIPVEKTTAYKVQAYVSLGLIPIDCSWTDLSKHGRKALLTSHELMWLVREIKNESQGGAAISSGHIKDKLKNYILTVWARKGKLHMVPLQIPEKTLNSFVAIIKAQCIFNLYDNVSNKTESRAVAEWSLRSTLAYATVVTCTHFLSNATSTYYHAKKKDLNPDAVELWNLAELCFNKMVGNTNKHETLLPVLPNLVTTTDEVTIFATDGKIHSKESFFLAAKPEEIKNEECHSGARNVYKTKLTGNSHCRGVRIVVNSTFTAGGLAVPIFVAVYVMSIYEMPSDPIIIINVPGLYSGSHQDIYSGSTGFIVFVRGSDNNSVSVENDSVVHVNNNDNVNSETEITYSRGESRIAQQYRKKVYYPFIKRIRRDKYQ